MEKKVHGNIKRLDKPNPETEEVVALFLTINGKEYKVERNLISIWGYALTKVDLELLFREGDGLHAALTEGKDGRERVFRAWAGPNTSVSECLANEVFKKQLRLWLARRSLNMSELANLAIGHGLLLRGKVTRLLPTRQNASCGAIKLSQSALDGKEVFFERKCVSIFGTQLLEHGDLGLLFPLDRSRSCDLRVQCEIRRLSHSEIKVWADILEVNAADLPVLCATRVVVTGKYQDSDDGSTARVVSFHNWLSSRGLNEDAFQSLVRGQHHSSAGVEVEEASKRRRRSSASLASEQSDRSESSLRRCPVCGVRHDLRDCEPFLAMAATDREEVLVRQRHCTVCLEYGHDAETCQLQFDCSYCDVKHNTLLHGSTFKRPQRSRERSPERRSEKRRASAAPSPPPPGRDRGRRRPSSPVASFDIREREEDLWRRKPAAAPASALAQRLGPLDDSVWQRLDAAFNASTSVDEDRRRLEVRRESERRPEPVRHQVWPSGSYSDRDNSSFPRRSDSDLFRQWEELDGGGARNSLTASIQDCVRKELDLDRGTTAKPSQPSLSDQLQALLPNGVLPRPVGPVLSRPAAHVAPSAHVAPPSAPSGPSAVRTSIPMLQQAELLLEQVMSCKMPTEAAEMGILKDHSQLKLAMFIHKTLAVSIKSYEEMRNLRNPVLEEMQAVNRSRTLGYP